MSARFQSIRARVDHLCGAPSAVPAIVMSMVIEAGIDVDVRCMTCRWWKSLRFRLWDLPASLPEAVEDVLDDAAPYHRVHPQRAGPIRAHMADGLARAWENIDPVSLGVSRRFAPPVRATIYWAIRHDTTGHVLRLARRKPGVLALVALCAPLDYPFVLATNPLPSIPSWREVVGGSSLDAIIAQVAERVGHPEARRARLRWLASRVPEQCDPRDVFRVSRLACVPKRDLPVDQHDRAQWIGFLADRLRGHDGEPEPDAVVRYASARYREVSALDPFRLFLLFRFIQYTGRRPSRSEPVAQQFAEMEAYAEEWAKLHAESPLAALYRMENDRER